MMFRLGVEIEGCKSVDSKLFVTCSSTKRELETWDLEGWKIDLRRAVKQGVVGEEALKRGQRF